MYACPSCGAGLRYDIASQKLVCDYCQTSLPPEHFEALQGSKEEAYFEATRYTCTQCGAELVSPDNTAATFCSFCGSSTLLEGRLSNEKKPDHIIPFKKTKKDCAKAYTDMMKHAWFAPDELKDASKIDGFRGIYMPYWIYEVSHDGAFSLNAQTQHRSGNYDITRYYKLSGEIDAGYLGMSHDASVEFSDDISEGLAPYNIKEMQDFQGSYLSGFYADISDVDPSLYSKEALDFANGMSIQNVRNAMEFRKYYITDSTNIAAPPFHSKLEKPKYALFPVWFMSYRNKDRIAYVSINGQTGQISADIPVDIKKYVTYSLLLTIPLFLFFQFFMMLNAGSLLTICSILSILALVFSVSEIRKIQAKDLGLTDKGLQSQQKAKEKAPSVFSAIRHRILHKHELAGIFMTFVSLLINLGVSVWNPVSDMFYYAAAILSIICTCFGMIDVMKDHNVLVTRKLPQFNREGGDDSAQNLV